MRRWLLILLSATLLLLVACTDHRSPQRPSPPAGPRTMAAGVDPPPVLPGKGQIFDSAGGHLDAGDVSVDVPVLAVAADQQIEVQVGEPLGNFVGSFTTELGGRPVEVAHGPPLKGPLVLSWDLSGLNDFQRGTLVLAKWDPEKKVWLPSSRKPAWSGTTLTLETEEFSVWTWLANLGQQVGQGVGARVDEPKCSYASLPSWVSNTVDPDEDLAAAAIRVCFEPDKEDRLTVRIANNRTFSQQLAMTYGDQKWAWTWAGENKYDVPAFVYTTAQQTLNDGTHFLMPPLSTQAVGIARPRAPGTHHIEAAAKVNGLTVFTDVVAYVFGQMPIGGMDNPILNALLQVLYECGGKALLGRPDPKNPTDAVAAVVHTVGDCADELLRPSSDFGARFENLSRKLIAKSGMSAAAAIQANRVVHEISSKFRILTVGELAFYLSDQFANATVGPLAWSVNARGQPQELGNWTPSCVSYAKDSHRLYLNLASQDEFADKGKDLWQFPGFADSAADAVEPLEECTPNYRSGLAAFLPTDWGDSKAARIAAKAILGALPATSTKSLLSARAPAMCRHKSDRLVNGNLPGQSYTSGFVAIRLKGSEYSDVAIKPARTDLTGDGGSDTAAVFVCSAGGVSWPNVIAIYGPGTVLLGSVDLGDYVHAEHSDVTSMAAVAKTIKVHWMSYEGCCFDKKNWVGTLRYRGSRFAITEVRQL